MVFFVSYIHVYTCPLYNVFLDAFVVVFQEIVHIFQFNMTLFVGSQSFISLPSFMFVSAAVSELRESNQNKEKKSEIGNFQFNTL